MRNTLLVLSLLFVLATPVAGQDQDLAKKTQNPVGDLISVPFQFNFNGDFGPDDEARLRYVSRFLTGSVAEELRGAASTLNDEIAKFRLED